jgi:hypothetical protein
MTRSFILALLATWFLLVAAPSVSAGPVYSLYDWAFNINGSIYQSALDYNPPAAGYLPSMIDTSGFDWATGLGVITIDYRPGPGYRYLAAFFDPEINLPINGYINEYGEFSSDRDPVAGQTWEIDEPGWNMDPNFPMGYIFQHVTSTPPALNNHNGVTIQQPYDVAMALAWGVQVPDGKRILLRLTLGTNAPVSEFYLRQIDTGTGDSLYYSGKLELADSQAAIPGVPEPGTWTLLAAGCLTLAGFARWRSR